MNIENIIADNNLILMEAAIVEILRRSLDVKLHPTLVNAPLIYEEKARKIMLEIYGNYVEHAIKNDTPIFICSPTWRTNQSRVRESDINPDINVDAIKFLMELKNNYKDSKSKIKVGGLIGCKNDCYKPEEGLSINEAEIFHSWQIDQLSKGGAEFLIAETLPSVDESIGIARAMEKSSLPYFISYVISKDGKVLDGTPLLEAINIVDHATTNKPIGYMVNCAYPSFICADKQPPELYDRLVGYLANASSLDHCDLDGAEDLKLDSVKDWGNNMLDLNKRFGVKILGGCCGTNLEHLQFLTDNY